MARLTMSKSSRRPKLPVSIHPYALRKEDVLPVADHGLQQVALGDVDGDHRRRKLQPVEHVFAAVEQTGEKETRGDLGGGHRVRRTGLGPLGQRLHLVVVEHLDEAVAAKLRERVGRRVGRLLPGFAGPLRSRPTLFHRLYESGAHPELRSVPPVVPIDRELQRTHARDVLGRRRVAGGGEAVRLHGDLRQGRRHRQVITLGFG
ncbi:hypothetical protein [Bradyrhizobium elkanii]|uniref:hypothetical protein n=1 Tax=Bradyrhizobium elkanii TaxID=29448 RepID=UPI003511EB3F